MVKPNIATNKSIIATVLDINFNIAIVISNYQLKIENHFGKIDTGMWYHCHHHFGAEKSQSNFPKSDQHLQVP